LPKDKFSNFSKSGFTLIELLIVVAVISIGALILLPNIDAVSTQGSDERSFRLINSALQSAQDQALISHTKTELNIDLTHKVINISGKSEPIKLPDSSDIVIIQENGEPISSGKVSIKIDDYGNIEPFEVKIGLRIKAMANPFTGLLEDLNEENNR